MMASYLRKNKYVFIRNALVLLNRTLGEEYNETPHLKTMLTIKTSEYGFDEDPERFFWNPTNKNENVRFQFEICYQCGNYIAMYLTYPDRYPNKIICQC